MTAFLFVAAIALATAARHDPRAQRRAAPADSAAILRDARRAQRGFEALRHMHLPVGEGGGHGCDAQIGRFCYWAEEPELEASPPEEPARIRRARDVLLRRLARAAEELPGDGWVAGQLVGYLIEAARPGEAVAAAVACRADRWWCDALAGLAHHAAGEFAVADSAFATALAEMPRDERCRWTDIAVLLDDEVRRPYGRLSCEARELFDARFWWLAQPLQSRPGNDLRTEYFARLTTTRIREHARQPLGWRWDDDLRQLVARYGWPRAWSLARTSSILGAPGALVGRDPGPSFDFRPSSRALTRPLESAERDWDFRAPRARMRYAPAYATRVATLEHQLARFARGDSMLVVAAYDVSRDTSFATAPVHGALVLSDSSGDALVVAAATGTTRGVATATIARSGALASVEVIADSARHVGRSRYAIRAAGQGGRLTISDVLLLDGPRPPTTLAEALPLARGTSRVGRSESFGVYWETYGLLPEGEPLTMSLTVVPHRAGGLRRVAEAVHLARPAPPVSLRWNEVGAPQSGVAARGLGVDLSRLTPGRYQVIVSVASRGGGTEARAVRDVEVTGP